eukprot:TRINITY_DN9864_c0_g1_i5.p1 TRINITY_DN9864_c0_g1~~TRINITY_DN9864_c0_g1_i5.p1  ORF type:complete len:834 (+),score=189.60 TRINITY_DN9864_c0_g1_i5:273-2774(+)
MYQTSLGQFLQWFDFSVKQSPKDRQQQKRIQNIITYLSFFVYRNVLRGLFERDKVTFKVMLALRILLTDGKLTPDYVNLLLKGGSSLAVEDNAPFEWLTKSAWLNVLQLTSSLDIFRDLAVSIRQNERLWKSWYLESAPEGVAIPIFQERFAGHPLGKFLRWLLIRSLRDDRAVVATSDFIADILGEEYTKPVTVTLESVWEDSNNTTPIVLLLSPGADPTAEIEALAKKRKITINSVSMGEGQEPNARSAVEKAAANGGFALLQNCHLGLGFMSKLMDFLDSLDPSTTQSAWRLWITCEPHPDFPISVLQRSIKVTNEPPQGLKAGLLRSFTTMVDQRRLERINGQEWRDLVFSLCFTHSVVQERRKFGAIGFNILYEFNAGDLDASLTFLERYMMSRHNQPFSWDTIKYMICEVQYGGRITDNFDRVLFKTYGDMWIGQQVFDDHFLFMDEFKGFEYAIPKSETLTVKEIQDYITSFPDSDSPEVFGLHPNADLKFGRDQAEAMLKTIESTQPKEGGTGTGKSREDVVYDETERLLAMIPPSYDMERVRLDIRTRPKAELEQVLAAKNIGKIDAFNIPLNVFLFQEIERLNRTILNVRKTLIELQQAIKGETIMTPELQEALDLIFNSKPPRAWYIAPSGDYIAWVSSALMAWMTGLVDRDRQLRTWLNNMRPLSFWLTGFFNPQGFLTAMRQEVTRRHQSGAEKWSLEDVELFSEVTDYEDSKRVRNPPDEGVYIHGLYLDGCSFNRATKMLMEPAPKEQNPLLPVLHVTAMTADKKRQALVGKRVYECPVYTLPKRTGLHYVCTVTLRTERDPAHWTVRGVALLLEVNP